MYTLTRTEYLTYTLEKGGLQGIKSVVNNLYVSCENDVNDQEKTIK